MENNGKMTVMAIKGDYIELSLPLQSQGTYTWGGDLLLLGTQGEIQLPEEEGPERAF